MRKRKIIFGILLSLTAFSILGFTATAQIEIKPFQTATPNLNVSPAENNQIVLANPTQTPYIIYVVVTATPESQSNFVTQLPVEKAPEGQCLVQQPDGSICTLGLEVVSEPTFASGAKVAEGEVFYKEWEVRNTGTCTWTKDYQFEFQKGWQIGSTRFNIRKETAPGETVNVQLGMTALLSPGDQYYSTYVLKSPTGVECGEITSKFTVVSGYYTPTKRPGPPKPGRPGPDDPYCYWLPGGNCYPWYPWYPWKP